MEYEMKYDSNYEYEEENINNESSKIDFEMYIMPILLFIMIILIYHFIKTYLCIKVDKIYHNMVMKHIIKEIDHDEIEDLINDCCSICLDKYDSDKKIVKLRCNHIYHKECITEWIYNNNECPLCRKEVI